MALPPLPIPPIGFNAANWGLPPPPLVPIDIEIDRGDDFVQCRISRKVAEGTGGPAALARVAVAMRAWDVPIIGTSCIIGVTRGTLFFVTTADHITYRWRA